MKKLAKLTNIIESILFVSGTQVAIKDIAEKLEVSDKDIMGAVAELNKKYNEESGVQILVFNKKLQFCSNPEYADQVSSVLNPIRERELSRSMLEVAAIIAYRQPVTRIDLEELRGANSEYAIQKLLELGVIEPVGRKDAVGRPVMFGTTDKFLKRFQISSLDDLPRYEELMSQIQSLHANDEQDDYLYKKDEYVENEGDNDTISTENNGDLANDEVAVTSNSNSVVNEDSNEDFDLPDIEDEELPEFLAGEEVEKF
ncbi:MAG: SMC-Scp complex subunit ScpB [Clostridia bacterium]|nr:SMC-Scp complex subunit ScpB [Clostridia bacterium]